MRKDMQHFPPESISPRLAGMLRRAGQGELADQGFAVHAPALELSTRLMRDRDQAIYHALFDGAALHNRPNLWERALARIRRFSLMQILLVVLLMMLAREARCQSDQAFILQAVDGSGNVLGTFPGFVQIQASSVSGNVIVPAGGGGGGTPGGGNNDIQFNAAGAFAGSPNFTYDPTLDLLQFTPTHQDTSGFNFVETISGTDSATYFPTFTAGVTADDTYINSSGMESTIPGAEFYANDNSNAPSGSNVNAVNIIGAGIAANGTNTEQVFGVDGRATCQNYCEATWGLLYYALNFGTIGGAPAGSGGLEGINVAAVELGVSDDYEAGIEVLGCGQDSGTHGTGYIPGLGCAGILIDDTAGLGYPLYQFGNGDVSVWEGSVDVDGTLTGGTINATAGYQAAGVAGVTGVTCTAWTDGLCTHT